MQSANGSIPSTAPEPVAVIGLGNMGVSVLGALLDRGMRVVAVDVDDDKLGALRQGRPLVPEHRAEEILGKGLREGRLDVRKGCRHAADCPVSFVAVQTPANGLDCDYGAMHAVMRELAEHVTPGHLVVVGSTVFPGGIANDILPFWTGRDVDIVYQPVFLRAGFGIDDFLRPGKAVAGVATPLQPPPKLVAMLDRVLTGVQPRYVSYAESEWIKVVHNAFMSLKIAFANEIAMLCEGTPADPARVIELTLSENERGRLLTSSHTKPGVPFSGPCLPKDADVLQGMIRRNVNAGPLSKGICYALRESNIAYRDRLINRWLAFAKEPNRPLGIVGMSFRPDFNEMRHSLALDFLRAASDRGIPVIAYDPAFENIDEREYVLACRQDSELLSLRQTVSRSLDEVWTETQGVLINRSLGDAERQRLSGLAAPPCIDLYGLDTR